MTNAEARRYILENWFDGDENADAVVGGDTETMAMKLAVKALERADVFEKKSTSMTNADKIRRMTDEELCNLCIWCECPSTLDCHDARVSGSDVCDQYDRCFDCWLDWLQGEVEDENHDKR